MSAKLIMSAIAVIAAAAVVYAVSSALRGNRFPQSDVSESFLDAGPNASNTSMKAQKGSAAMGGEVLAVDERMSLPDGTQDVSNRYPFAVMVRASSAKTGETLKCTGILIHPRLVLTAGHCLCMRHKSPALSGEAEWVIAPSVCANTVVVTTVAYQSQDGAAGDPTETLSNHYRGEVQPHPELQVILDSQSRVLTSHADLAVVPLSEPVEPTMRPIRLASSEPGISELILMIGYGYDATNDLIYGIRRFGLKKITKILKPQGDQVLLGPHGKAFTSGSGEPCLRQDKEGLSLVGISSKEMGGMPACTSVQPYRAWIDDEIKKIMTRERVIDGGSR